MFQTTNQCTMVDGAIFWRHATNNPTVCCTMTVPPFLANVMLESSLQKGWTYIITYMEHIRRSQDYTRNDRTGWNMWREWVWRFFEWWCTMIVLIEMVLFKSILIHLWNLMSTPKIVRWQSHGIFQVKSPGDHPPLLHPQASSSLVRSGWFSRMDRAKLKGAGMPSKKSKVVNSPGNSSDGFAHFENRRLKGKWGWL